MERQLIGKALDLSAAQADGTIALPAWMMIRCPTANRTAQIGASAVRTGLGANVARAVSRDGVSWGVLVEPARKNYVTEQDLSNWSDGGTPLLNSITGPDGSSGLYEVEDDSATTAESKALSGLTLDATGQHTLSAWTLLTAPAPSTACRLTAVFTALAIINMTGTDADWTLRSATQNFTGTSGSVTAAPRIITTADQGACGYWGMQIEAGRYPTSFIGADNATFERAADTLFAAAAAVLNGGRFKVTLTLRPHYAHGETSGDHNWLYFDEDNRVFFRQSDQKVVLRIGGVDLESSALTFSRLAALTVTLESSATQRRIVVSGAATGNGTTRAGAGAEVRHPAVVHILGGLDGAEEGADLMAFDANGITFAELANARQLAQHPYGGNLDRFLQVVADEVAQDFDVGMATLVAFGLDYAVGDQLDVLGKLVGLSREGFGDDRFRDFIAIKVELILAEGRDEAEWTGTCPNIIRIARTFIGDSVDPVGLTNVPPYAYQIDIPSLVLDEASLLVRFLSEATYAAVRGVVLAILGPNSLWDSVEEDIVGGGIWDSVEEDIAGAAVWGAVVTTD